MASVSVATSTNSYYSRRGGGDEEVDSSCTGSTSYYTTSNTDSRRHHHGHAGGKPPLRKLGGWFKKNLLNNNNNNSTNNSNNGGYGGRRRARRYDYDRHYEDDDDRSYYSEDNNDDDVSTRSSSQQERSSSSTNNSTRKRRSRSLDPSTRSRRHDHDDDDRERDDSRRSASSRSSSSRSRSSRDPPPPPSPPFTATTQDDDDDDDDARGDIHFVESVEDIQKLSVAKQEIAPPTTSNTLSSSSSSRKPKTTLIRTDSDLSNVSEKLQSLELQKLQDQVAQQQQKVDDVKQQLRTRYGQIVPRPPNTNKQNDASASMVTAGTVTSSASVSMLMTPSERRAAIEELKQLIPKLHLDSKEHDLALRQLKEFEEFHLCHQQYDGSSLLSAKSSFSFMSPSQRHAALQELKGLLPLLENPEDHRLALQQIEEFEQQQQQLQQLANIVEKKDDDDAGNDKVGRKDDDDTEEQDNDVKPRTTPHPAPGPLPPATPARIPPPPSMFQRTPSIERIAKMPFQQHQQPSSRSSTTSSSSHYAFTRTPSSERIAQNPMLLGSGRNDPNNGRDRSSSRNSSSSTHSSSTNSRLRLPPSLSHHRTPPPEEGGGGVGPVDLDESVLSSPRGGGGGFNRKVDGPVDLDESVLSSPRGGGGGRGGYHPPPLQPQIKERQRRLVLPTHGRGPVDLDESVISSHVGGYGSTGGGGLIIHRSRSKEQAAISGKSSSSSHSRSHSGRSYSSSQHSSMSQRSRDRSRSSSPSSLKRNLKYSSQSLVDGRWMSSMGGGSSVNSINHHHQRRDNHDDQYYGGGASSIRNNDIAPNLQQRQKVEETVKTDDEHGCVQLCGPTTTTSSTQPKERIAGTTPTRTSASLLRVPPTPNVLKRSNSTSDLHRANEEFARQQLRAKLQQQQKEEAEAKVRQQQQRQDAKKKAGTTSSSSIFDCIPICGNGKSDVLDDDAALTIKYSNGSVRRRSEPTLATGTFHGGNGLAYDETGLLPPSSLRSPTRSMQSHKSRGEYWNDEDNQSKATAMVGNRTKTVAFAEVHDSVETGSTSNNYSSRGRKRSSGRSRRRSLSADGGSDRSPPQYSYERNKSKPRVRSESPPRSFMKSISNGLRNFRLGRGGGNGTSTMAQASLSNPNNNNIRGTTKIPPTLPKSVPAKRNSSSSYGMSTVSSLTFDHRKRRNGLFATSIPKKDTSKRSFKTVEDPSEFMEMDSDTSSSKKSKSKKHIYNSGSSFNTKLQSIPEAAASNANNERDLKLKSPNNDDNDDDVSFDAVEVTLSPRAKALLDKKEKKRELSSWNMTEALSANVKNMFSNDQHADNEEGEDSGNLSTDRLAAIASRNTSTSAKNPRKRSQSPSHDRDHRQSTASTRSDVPRKSLMERVRKGLASKGRSRSLSRRNRSSSSLAATVGDGSFEIMADAHPRPSNTLVREFDDTDSETEQFWSNRKQSIDGNRQQQHQQQQRSSSLPPRHNNKRKDDVMKKDIKDVLAMGNKPGALGMPFDKLLQEGKYGDVDGDSVAARWESTRTLQRESSELKKNKKSPKSTTPGSTQHVKSDHSFAGPISIDGSTLGSSYTDDDSTTLKTADHNTANGEGGVTGWLYNMASYWNTTSDEKDAEYYYQQGLRDAMKAHRRKLETERQKEIDARGGGDNRRQAPNEGDGIQDAVNAAIKETTLLVTNSDMDVVAEIKRESGDNGDEDHGTTKSSKSSKSKSNVKKTKSDNKPPMTKLEYKLFMDNLKNKVGGNTKTKSKSDKYIAVEDDDDHKDLQTNTVKKKKKDKYAVG